MSLFCLKPSRDIWFWAKALLLTVAHKSLRDLGPGALQPHCLLVPLCSASRFPTLTLQMCPAQGLCVLLPPISTWLSLSLCTGPYSNLIFSVRTSVAISSKIESSPSPALFLFPSTALLFFFSIHWYLTLYVSPSNWKLCDLVFLFLITLAFPTLVQCLI